MIIKEIYQDTNIFSFHEVNNINSERESLKYKSDIKESKDSIIYEEKKEKILKKIIIDKKLLKFEDKAQDCNAYLKIKHFLAKQVIELESIIEEKDSYILANTIKINTYSKFLNNAKKKIKQLKNKYKNLKTTLKKNRKYLKNIQINNITDEKQKYSISEESPQKNPKKNSFENNSFEKKNFNLSNEIESCNICEKCENENSKILNHSITKNKLLLNLIDDRNNEIKNEPNFLEIEKFMTDFIEKIKRNFEKKYNVQNKKIFEYKNRNVLLNSENKILNSSNEKLETQNIILLNELIEIVQTLRIVDINLLNKIFIENLSKLNKEDFESIKLTSCLGIKYNILSAESFLSYLINSKNSPEYLNIEKKDNINKNNYSKIKNHKKNKNFTNNLKSDLFTKYYKKNCDNLPFNHKIELEKNIDFNKIRSKGKNKKENMKEFYENFNETFNFSDSLNSSFLSDDSSNSSDNSFDYDQCSNLSEENNESIDEVKINQININNRKNNLNKLIDFSKYEQKLNELLENNLKKIKLLNFSDSE